MLVYWALEPEISKLADFGEIVWTFILSVCSNYNVSIMKSTIDPMALSQTYRAAS